MSGTHPKTHPVINLVLRCWRQTVSMPCICWWRGYWLPRNARLSVSLAAHREYPDRDQSGGDGSSVTFPVIFSPIYLQLNCATEGRNLFPNRNGYFVAYTVRLIRPPFTVIFFGNREDFLGKSRTMRSGPATDHTTTKTSFEGLASSQHGVLCPFFVFFLWIHFMKVISLYSVSPPS